MSPSFGRVASFDEFQFVSEASQVAPLCFLTDLRRSRPGSHIFVFSHVMTLCLESGLGRYLFYLFHSTCGSPGFTHDLLGVMSRRIWAWHLESCDTLPSALQQLLTTKFQYMQTHDVESNCETPLDYEGCTQPWLAEWTQTKLGCTCCGYPRLSENLPPLAEELPSPPIWQHLCVHYYKRCSDLEKYTNCMSSTTI